LPEAASGKNRRRSSWSNCAATAGSSPTRRSGITRHLHFRPSLFDFTAKLQKSPRGEYELTDAISAMVVAGQKLAGLEIQGRWVDVRDPETLARLEGGNIEH